MIHKQNYNFRMVVLIFIMVFFSAFLIPAYSKAATLEDLSAIERYIYDSYSGSNSADLSDAAVKDMVFTQDDFDSIVYPIYSALQPFAIALIVIYVAVDMMENVMGGLSANRGLSENVILTSLGKLIIAECLIGYGPQLIGWLLNMNNWFIYHIGQLFGTSGGSPANPDTINQELVDYCKNIGIMDAIGQFIPATLNNLASAVATLGIRFQSIAKKFEMTLMTSFSVVAFAGTFGRGRETAFRYFKRILACGLHAAAIVLILSISDRLAGNLGISGWTAEHMATAAAGAILLPFLYKFAAIGSIATAKALINDALGS